MQNQMNEEHDLPKQSRRGLWLLSAGLIVTLTATAAGLFLLNPFSTSENNEILYLKADQMPYRVRPAENGGKDIPHQDSSFMGFLDGADNQSEGGEIISLQDMSPEPPPVKIQQAQPEKPQQIKSDTDKQTVTATPINGQDSPLQEQNEDKSQTALTAEKKGPSDKDTTKESKKTATDQKSATAETKIEDKKTANAPDSEDSIMQVQLAAFQSQEKAVTAAALLSEKHKSRLDGHQLQAIGVKKEDGAMFWRVMTRSMSVSSANELCNTLKRAGQDCILRKKNRPKP